MDLLYSQIKIWWDEQIFFFSPPIDLTSRLQIPITRLSAIDCQTELQQSNYKSKKSAVRHQRYWVHNLTDEQK